MLSNRAIEVRLKKTPPGDSPEPAVVQTVDLKELESILQNQVRNVAVAVGAIIGGKKILDTVCEIAVLTAKAKIR